MTAARRTVWLVVLMHLATPVMAAPTDPLVKASTDGNLAVVKRLLASGASPDSHDDFGLTALNWAAYKGHTPVVRLLVQNHANVNSNSNAKGWTPLMNAANGGFDTIVSVLLAAGAEANLKSTEGATALWFAAASHKTKTIGLLRAHGAAGDIAPVLEPQVLCDAANPLFAGNEKGLVWSAYNDKPGHYGCNAVHHAYPGEEGGIIMINFQADGDKTGGRSVTVNSHVYASEVPKDLVNATLLPLLRSTFSNLGRGSLPDSLAGSIAVFDDIDTDSALGHITAHFKTGDDPSLPNNGAEYRVTVELK